MLLVIVRKKCSYEHVLILSGYREGDGSLNLQT